MEEIADALTVQEFAERKNVQAEVILRAIRLREIIPIEINYDNLADCTIHPAYLDTFKVELISVADYADRKRVTERAIYKKIDAKKIEYFLDPVNNTMKIDWVKYKDVHFRAVQYKHKGKNRLIKK